MAKVACYVRTHRLKSGLRQKDLIRLLPDAGRNRVSTTERAHHPPNADELFAYEVLFGVGGRDLFPRYFAKIEEMVMERAYTLHNALEGTKHPKALKRKRFLETVLARAVARGKRNRV